MNKLTRTITFGATAAAFFTLMYAVFAVNESLIQEAVSIVAVMPLCVYTCLFGARAGLLAGTASLLLSAFLVQPYVFVINAIPAAIVAVTLGILALRAKPLVTFGIVSGILFLQLFYELAAAKLFFRINGIEEYVRFIDSVTAFFRDGSVAAQYVQDLALCGIPAVFALSAMAKTFVYGFVLFILLVRVFKQRIRLSLPNLRINDVLFAWIFLGSEVVCAALVTLALTGVTAYSFAYAVISVALLAFMYVYLLYGMRNLELRRRFSPVKAILISCAIIAVFPFADTFFAIHTLVNSRK